MFFDNKEEIIQARGKVVYIAVCIPAPQLDQVLLRNRQIVQTYKECETAAKDEDTKNVLDIKNEFHCTLQFFQPPRDPVVNNAHSNENREHQHPHHHHHQISSSSDSTTPRINTNESNSNNNGEKSGNDCDGSQSANSTSNIPKYNPVQDRETESLLSLVGTPVQMSLTYVAFTPRIIAARLSILSPTPVALACANACPHITLAVGNSAQAVWSNELLCFLESKTVPPATERDVKSGVYQKRCDELWSKARVVGFSGGTGIGNSVVTASNVVAIEGGTQPLLVSGQVRAWVQLPKNSNKNQNSHPHATAVSPRLMSPTTLISTPSSASNERSNAGTNCQNASSRSNTPTNKATRGGNQGGRSSNHTVANGQNNNNNNNNPYTEINASSTNNKRGSAMSDPPGRGNGGGGRSPRRSSQQAQQQNNDRDVNATNNANDNNDDDEEGNNDGRGPSTESPMRRESTLQG